MEAKKSAAAAAPAAAGAGPPPANGYFSSVFPASPVANSKDAKQADLYTMLNKQNPKGQYDGGIAGNGKCQGSLTKGHVVYKDAKQAYPNESESPYFGSSVHYGGREFYGSSPQKQVNESPRNNKEESPDGSLATRGDWWQGSLYY